MGRERQKRKNRSSLPKVRQRTKSKKRVLQNPIIQANWDKHQTLTQNYRRLGLTAKLNKLSGGQEKKISDLRAGGTDERPDDKGDGLTILNGPSATQISLAEVEVERDPETGRILRVIQKDDLVGKPNPLNDPLNDLDSDYDEEGTWVGLDNQHGNVESSSVSRPDSVSHGAKTDVVRQLEERASMPAAKYKRKQTENERAFIEDLVRKYGDDYSKMARDMKINYMQRSAGDLKRRIKKWKESGGAVG